MASSSLVEDFSRLEDPRIERHKQHKLIDIIVLSVCAVLCGAEGWEAIEEFGHTKLEWLRRLVALENGIPSHDTIARVLSRVSAPGLQACFLSWVKAVAEVTGGQIVAIDGKTLRRSYDKASRKQAIHMVSAWGSANGLVLASLPHPTTGRMSYVMFAIGWTSRLGIKCTGIRGLFTAYQMSLSPGEALINDARVVVDRFVQRAND